MIRFGANHFFSVSHQQSWSMLPCCNLSLTLHASETSLFQKYGAKIIQLWIFLTLKATTSPTAGDRWHQNMEPRKYTVYFYLEWQTLHRCPSLSASYFIKRPTTGRSASIRIYKYQMSSSLQLPLLSLPLSLSYSPFLRGSLALEDSLHCLHFRGPTGDIIFAKGEGHHYAKGRIFELSCIISMLQQLLSSFLKLSLSLFELT